MVTTPPDTLLRDAWRCVARLVPVSVSLPELAAIAARQMAGTLVLWRLEPKPERYRLEEGSLGREPLVLSQVQREELLGWCRRGLEQALEAGRPVPPPLAALLSGPQGRVLLVGPLGCAGLLGLTGEGALQPEQAVVFRALLEPFERALEHDRLARELEQLRHTPRGRQEPAREELAEPIIGAEEGLKTVLERVRMVAGSDMPVVLLGETGSGKEVVARAIHAGSPRQGGPFLRVNCGAIPAELIDSELFGHEKGSFTGATASRRGWFERADRGTLFLDEIGELPPAAQVRLLRILQDQALVRVGGEEPLTVDVRIIAATHRDLATMVQEDRFRQDLWYRLAVFPIQLPALRQRRDDIPALAEYFAHQAARRFGLPARPLTGADLELLRAYDWPGNVRELAAVMDRATILGRGRRLEVGAALCLAPSPSVVPSPGPVPGGTGILPLEQAMRQHILAALNHTQGRVEGPHGAAALLAINPNTLRGRMRRLGIRRFPGG